MSDAHMISTTLPESAIREAEEALAVGKQVYWSKTEGGIIASVGNFTCLMFALPIILPAETVTVELILRRAPDWQPVTMFSLTLAHYPGKKEAIAGLIMLADRALE